MTAGAEDRSRGARGPRRRLRRALKRVLLRLGIDVRKARSFGGYGAFEDQRRLLAARPIAPDELTVVDAGAHVGEVSRRYRRLFPEATIHAFEPAPRAFAELERRLAGDRRAFAHRAALGERSGTAALHLNRDEVTSSLLPAAAAADVPELAGRTATVETVEVPLESLDEWAAASRVDRIHLLKMDVQGAELAVLGGARSLLAAGDVWLIYTEVSFARLYEGQAFFWQVADELAGHRFELFNLYNCKTGARGQLTWGDAIFLGPRMLAAG